MKKRITTISLNPNDILSTVICTLLTLYSTLSMLLNRFMSTNLQFIILIGVMVLELYYLGVKWHKSLYLFILAALAMIVIPFLTFNRNAWSHGRTMFFVDTLLMCFMIVKRADLADRVLSVMGVMYMFYAICTIAFYFMPGFYRGYVVDLFPDSKLRLIRWYNSGCMPGLTNHYSTNGMFMATGLVLSLSRMQQNRKLSDWGRSLIFVIALLLTGKRAHFIFGAFTLFMMTYYWQRSRGGNVLNRWFRFIGIILVLLSVGVIVISSVPALSTFLQRFQLDSGSDDISSGRFMLWSLAVQSFLKHPILGIGWEMFKPSVSVLYMASDRLFDVHNVYIQLLCEVGVIGFALYMWWFIRCFMKSAAVYRRPGFMRSLNGRERNRINFALGFQIFFLLYCFTGNPLYDREMFFPYFLSCGIALHYGLRSDPRARAPLTDNRMLIHEQIQ